MQQNPSFYSLFYFFLLSLTLFDVDTVAGQSCEAALPQYAPTPPQPPELPEEGYILRSFGDGAYTVLDGVNTVFFLVSDAGVIVVDCMTAFQDILLDAIRRTTDMPVTHVVYSHFHWDHIGAARMFGDNVTRIGHEETALNLIELNDPRRPVPGITFKDNYRLEVGNQTLELAYRGQIHADGNIFIFAPKQRILMLADFLYPGWSPSSKFGWGKNVLAYERAHDQVLEYNFEHFVGVHVGLAGNRTDVIIQREYVSDLRQYCIETVNAYRVNGTLPGCPDGFNLAGPENFYGVGRRLFEVLAVSCANRVIDKWVDRLSGVDVTAYLTADVLIDSLRLEVGIEPIVF